MGSRQDDTIAALATPPGAGALAVIRLSGPAALAVADRAFRGPSPLSSAPGHSVHVGRLLAEDDTLLDDVVAVLFRAPRSFTGEDLVEISCHGGPLLAARALRSLLARGARPADPGEFTRRAFLNGRMDLAQAEAVAALIAAGSDRARRASLDQLHGGLSRRVEALRTDLLALCGRLELNLDFAEERIDIAKNSDVVGEIQLVIGAIGRLLAGWTAGRLIRDGFRVAIAGNTNAGKSSIFNRLLESDRAIVTPHPGTTRDMLEENALIRGFLFTLRDTAGIRETTDPVELEGIRRAESAIRQADILMVVADATLPDAGRHLHGWAELGAGKPVVQVWNKVDLLPPGTLAGAPAGVVPVSARTGSGIDLLRERLVHEASRMAGGVADGEAAVNERHRAALERALRSLELALESASQERPQEFVAMDLRGALNSIAEITGEITTDEILDGIFSRFCIGK